MTDIIPDIEHFSPDEEKLNRESLLSFAAWAVRHGCEVEYLESTPDEGEVAIIHEIRS